MKLKELSRIEKPYFGYEEISRVFGISLASAKVTASRYVRQGLLLRMKNNVYLRREVWNAAGVEEKFLIANLGQVPSYISLMTALEYYEVTTQALRNFFESVSIKRTKEINLNGSLFRYTKIASGLYFGFKKEKKFFIATPEKALLDAFYLMSYGRYALDISALDATKLNGDEVNSLSAGFPLKTRKLLKSMDILRQHEIFEIEVLEKMNSARMLDPLIFGGGSMLRLCHELNRYSVDLDFWFVKTILQDNFFDMCRKAFEKDYEITDAQMKHYTILFELRSAQYPKRLKIEIRREWKDCDYQQTIAFSRFSTRQVLLKAHTLNQTIKNKIEAFLDRGEIRDCFDIEFMLRRGVGIPLKDKGQSIAFQKKLARLKDRDFKVKLGSILEDGIREYYVTHRFRFLQEKLASIGL